MDFKRCIGIIFPGAMGIGVVRSLLWRGFDVPTCDIRPDVLQALAAEGASAYTRGRRRSARRSAS